MNDRTAEDRLRDALAAEADEVRAHFTRRFKLYNEQCAFRCPPDCERICCQDVALQVEVSLFDLIGLALALDERPSHLFRAHCRFAPFNTAHGLFVRRVGIELARPCAFHDGRLCRAHAGRPVACALFPESVYLSPRWRKQYVGSDRFCRYACMATTQEVEPGRAKVVSALQREMRAEALASDLYLFGVLPLLIDFRNLAEELVERGQRILPHQGAELRRYIEQRRVSSLYTAHVKLDEETIKEIEQGKRMFIPHEAFVQVLLKRFRSTAKHREFIEHLEQLDIREGREALVSTMKAAGPLAAGDAKLPGPFIHEFEDGELRLRPPI